VEFHDAWNVQKDLLQQHVNRLGRQHQQKHQRQQQQQQHQQKGKPAESLSTEHGSFWRLSSDTGTKDTGLDTVIMLQHEPVYTLGTASDESFIHSNTGTDTKIPTIRMDRGGEVTYHGPGQLTVYPVVDLRNYQQDIHWYCRALEEAVLIALHDCGIVNAKRDNATTGVWVDNYKVAAVGIKCRKWITQHGVAINVESSSVAGFDNIVPCGLVGRQVGCVNQFLQEQQQPKALTVAEFAVYMQSALEEVFCIELVQE
jgi:lipoyl(octanoyl) transferase